LRFYNAFDLARQCPPARFSLPSEAQLDASISQRRNVQRPNGIPPLAVLDLGTNNCRLLIASPDGRGGFRVTDSFSRIVRLGEGVQTSGLLSQAAMDRTVAALKICSERIRHSGAVRIWAIATQAARIAKNASILVERVRAETGLTLEVISAEREADLAALGCAPLIGRKYKGALVFDIGGGSTEIIRLERRGAVIEKRFAASLPLGVVTLAERAPLHGLEDYRQLSRELTVHFAELAKQMGFDPESEHLLGTSGTVTTLAAIALGLPRYIRAQVDASWHKTETLVGVADRLAGMDQPALARIGSIGASRADLMLPGCAIFASICNVWPSPMLRVADRGLREGMLRHLTEEELVRGAS
jgi:exopolyphosphatase/guanosine-5'-triphosphate,3'-diphosphate pyrophosphatase